ncbi:ferrous iron transport protein B [Marinigracilibium pacificum]|uniref:Ferrous iron transport protein B n=1 Tax=Marinigracilibium pacificum TaxID=2729599 RepID=A0A848J4G4_9BACT|nr:ferrous iron transport protein B [Marinigracilibium pacificum]NMM50641.1 ferrous iron transport protein B [Marinigracilibium pacificum]
MSNNNLPTLALLGNPNCGKSSIFNILTGLRQKVGNFPGVTVDKKIGTTKLVNETVKVIDFPGTYSLYPTSKDESIIIKTFSNPQDENYPDVVVYVADVTKLEPQMLLLTQILDLNIPVVLALNMTDLAEENKLTFDEEKLRQKFGIPVVAVSSRKEENIDKLKEAAHQVLSGSKHLDQKHKAFYKLSENEKHISREISESLNIKNDYRSILVAHHFHKMNWIDAEQKEIVKSVVDKYEFNDLRSQINETMARYDRFAPIVRDAVRKSNDEARSLTDKIDRVLTHKILGPVIFFAMMFLIFHAIFSWSSYPMDAIDWMFAEAGNFIKTNLPDTWYTSLLADGIIAGLGGVLVFIPQIAILFLLITILEEIGYMSRAVFMFDNIMQKFGLNGRSIVALISGGACAVPAVMATRTISNWKERLITILVTPLISCSARIPVYTLLIAFAVPPIMLGGFVNAQALMFMGLYLLGIVGALVAAIVFKWILKTEEHSFLMIELPPYRKPNVKNVLLTVREKVEAFVFQAGKVIMIISVILWFLASYGPGDAMETAKNDAIEVAQAKNLTEDETEDLIASKQIESSYAGYFGKAIEPSIKPLGFNWQIGIAIITSFAAREVFVGTMATIYSIASKEDDEATIRSKLMKASDPDTGEKTYTVATSVSLLLFYVFAMQCMSTLAVVKRETKSWKWPVIQFVFMGVMAYLSSFIAYQLLS